MLVSRSCLTQQHTRAGHLVARLIGSNAVSRYQQARAFRFGRPWIYYPEVESRHGDVYRRGRCFRYKYMEINRGTDGSKHLLGEDARGVFMRIVRDYLHDDGKNHKSKDSNTGSSFRTPDNPEGVRPGQNIEDAERAPLENLLFGRYCQEPIVELEYDIDPITNRKVPKRSTDATSSGGSGESGETLSRTFKAYRSRFSSLNAPVIDRKAWGIDTLPETFMGRNSKQSVSDGYAGAEAHEPQVKQTLDDISARKPVLGSESYVSDINSGGKHKAGDRNVGKPDSDNFAPDSGISPTSWWRHNSAPQHPEFQRPGSKTQGAPFEGGMWNRRAEELSNYEPYESCEPDGKYGASIGPAMDPEELAKYKPFQSHEPDGKYAADYIQPDIDASELARYSRPYFSHEPNGKYAERDLSPSAHRTELSDYQPYKSHEPHGRYSGDDAESAPSVDELHEYHNPSHSHEPDGKYAQETEDGSESSDLGNHEAFGYEDSETSRFPLEGQGDENAVELREYGAMRHAEMDGLPEVEPEEPACGQSELKQYGAFKWNELDGKPLQRALSEEPLFEYGSEKVSTDPPDRNHDYRKILDSFMAQSAAVSDAVDADTSVALKQSKGRLCKDKESGLTGNYARDFPEEFSRSWKSEASGTDPSLLPADLSTADVGTSDSQGAQPPVPRPTHALQPALERHNAGNLELNQETPKKVTKTAPTLYKVLVYDPTMQCIDIAETTSIVADNAAPLTPAEVLLRVSNPSKFLPHFGPLQSQGFEIVSGAGDVLIFRKVRDSFPTSAAVPVAAASTTVTETPAPEPIPSRPAVNPIDMTGGPRDYTIAASRFASPTGFVNYDLPPPRFPSGIDVRREEPVFSGPKEETKNKRSSLPKRLVVGAAWVAGISYSLGVVGEYFRTGGHDGEGHRGL